MSRLAAGARAARLGGIGLAGLFALAACGGGGDRPVAARPIEDPGFVAAGPYQLHYSAVLTSDLPAEVASAYNIARSRDRALINVSMLRRDDSGPPHVAPLSPQPRGPGSGAVWWWRPSPSRG